MQRFWAYGCVAVQGGSVLHPLSSHGGGMYIFKVESVKLMSCSFSSNRAVCVCLVWLEYVQAVLVTCHALHGCYRQGSTPDAGMRMLLRAPLVSAFALKLLNAVAAGKWMRRIVCAGGWRRRVLTFN